MVLKRFSLPVSGHLFDYRNGIAALESDSITEAERAEFIRKLCEISRDIDWNLGDPRDYVESYIGEIAQLLRRTLAVIDARPEWNTGQVPTHREHIEMRYKKLRDARPRRNGRAMATAR